MFKEMFKDDLVKSSFICNLLYSIGYPTVHLTLMGGINEKLLSFNMIVTCFSGVIFSLVWKKFGDKYNLYKYMGILLCSETVLYIVLVSIYLSGNASELVYYLADTLLFALVTKNIILGSNKLKSIRYIGEEREQYDNNIDLVSNISCLVGFGSVIIFTCPLWLGFICSSGAIICDNYYYYRAYKETTKVVLKEDV